MKLFYLSTLIGLAAGVCSSIFNLIVSSLIGVNSHLIGEFWAWRIIIPLVVLAAYLAIDKKSKTAHALYGLRAVQNEIDNIDSQIMLLPKVINKLFLTAISVASGFLVGPFGPTAHLGGAIGSHIAYREKLDSKTRLILIAAGTAAAIAAVQRNPLFATVFVIEVVLQGRYIKYAVPILYAACIATITDMSLIGDKNVYALLSELRRIGIENINSEHTSMLISIIFIAIASGLMAGIYIYLLGTFKNVFTRIRHKNIVLVLLVFTTCAFAVGFPSLMYLDTDFVFNSELTSAPFMSGAFMLLFATLVVKLILSTLQQGLGIHGGSFKPGLYIGLLNGLLLFTFLPAIGLPQPPLGTSLLISAACMIAGFANAPLSAIVLATELMHHEGLPIVLIISVLIAHACSRPLVNKVDRIY